MGLIFIDASVKNNNKHKEINMLVDSGASYSLITKAVWQALGIEPKKEMEFVLADGSKYKKEHFRMFFIIAFSTSRRTFANNSG